MKLNEYKTVKLSPILHNELKIYCVMRGYKLNEWIGEQLEKVIKELNEEENDR